MDISRCLVFIAVSGSTHFSLTTISRNESDTSPCVKLRTFVLTD
jgi:hypothetical protein